MANGTYISKDLAVIFKNKVLFGWNEYNLIIIIYTAAYI